MRRITALMAMVSRKNKGRDCMKKKYDDEKWREDAMKLTARIAGIILLSIITAMFVTLALVGIST